VRIFGCLKKITKLIVCGEVHVINAIPVKRELFLKLLRVGELEIENFEVVSGFV